MALSLAFRTIHSWPDEMNIVYVSSWVVCKFMVKFMGESLRRVNSQQICQCQYLCIVIVIGV